MARCLSAPKLPKSADRFWALQRSLPWELSTNFACSTPKATRVEHLVTVWPTSATSPMIAPALWALIGCSIFIAPRTTTSSPAASVLGRTCRRARGIRVERNRSTRLPTPTVVGCRCSPRGLGGVTNSAGFYGSRSSGDWCTAQAWPAIAGAQHLPSLDKTNADKATALGSSQSRGLHRCPCRSREQRRSGYQERKTPSEHGACVKHVGPTSVDARGVTSCRRRAPRRLRSS